MNRDQESLELASFTKVDPADFISMTTLNWNEIFCEILSVHLEESVLYSQHDPTDDEIEELIKNSEEEQIVEQHRVSKADWFS
jgi:hypothetical protein